MKLLENIDFKRWALANFIVLALLGVLLRYMLNHSTLGLNYLHILHAHSHFAFAGWAFMALAILIIKETSSDNTTFKLILLLTILSSYGMLISFSLQGYKATSISFSTLFLFLTYWFGYLAYRKWTDLNQDIISSKLLKASIWFLVISSLGPLALGWLKATGNTGPIFQNSIYFYLHFQMNGWMLFAALAVISRRFLTADLGQQRRIGSWLNAFIFSTIPLYSIFTLWSKPSMWIFLIAFIATISNAVSWFVIMSRMKDVAQRLPLLVQIALLAISFKVISQILVCIPFIAEWVFPNRNLIIGYVHLITLGCVTPIIIDRLIARPSATVNWFYTGVTIAYLFLLFIQPVLRLFAISLPHYQYCLFAVSVLYCLCGLMFLQKAFNSKSRNSIPLKISQLTLNKFL